MQAELAVIEGGPARRRFALGCVRAVLADPRAMRIAAVPAGAAAVGVLALALAWGIASADLRAAMISLVVTLALCAGWGRRAGFLGPVGASRTARRVRGMGCAAVGACLLLLVGGFRFPAGSPDKHGSGVWVVAAAVVLYLLALFSVTGASAGVDPATLRVGAGLALAGTVAWWIPMLLLATLRAQPQWALAVVAAIVGLATTIGAGRPGRTGQGVRAGLAAGAATCLLLFVVMVSTYAVLPRLVPDIAGPTTAGGLSPADRAATNLVESTDPYVVELLLGAMLGAALIGGRPGVATPVRSRTMFDT